MGERIQHIAGIVFALMFIAILAMINSSVLDIGGSVNDRLVRTYGVTEMHELQAFDDTTVTGATVRSAINNADVLYDYELEVWVDGTQYGDGHADPSSIRPDAMYEASLDINANGMTTGIRFTTP